ncbi:hypothetical protein [Saccharothrix coeruleofusca]|uniref:Uncharacterized protein n=1 Tax=Saccharothrix coeruleofusca TaxID=33919 RepID=A0A918ARH9_9PSEU|nr:hypothetical protein [Saccharothrix coeruleofusca]MBP2335425.1 hypothetical protein [Saccharothrix coeruleofusca]GGP77712.1 hypothetical protein GCM10010185_59400 [Saccharothrix coeruleofusca]
MDTVAVDWEPFIESLHEAAAIWDTALACRARQPELDEEAARAVGERPPAVVPVTAADAERLMTAVAVLARRLSLAAECVVYVTARPRLDLVDEDTAGEIDALSLTALHAQAMRHAADLARAASEVSMTVGEHFAGRYPQGRSKGA